MEKMVLTLHIVVCVVLVILVLLQSGKEGMGVIFGGGSSSLFGSTGAGGILVKLTTFVAVIFLATSLGYNMLTSVKGSAASTVIDVNVDDDPSAPAKPALPAVSVNATSSATGSPATQTPAARNASGQTAPAQAAPAQNAGTPSARAQ